MLAHAAPVFAVEEVGIPCGEEAKSTCFKSDHACSAQEECQNTIGASTCLNGFCYLDKIAKREYDTHKTTFIWGLISLQNDIVELKKPALQIKIPGLNFSDVSQTLDKQGYIHIPYIGELITALYKYGIALASMIGVVIIIKCGVKIILSAGGDEKMDAYHQIGQVCIGLVILWGSYAFLYTINPDLVVFKPLRVKYIEPFPLTSYDKEDVVAEMGDVIGKDEKGFIKYECRTQPATRGLTDTTYDDVFEKYGKCIPYDWRTLKAISYVESGHRAEVVNCAGFTGLFQTKTKYANDFLKSSIVKDPKINLGDPAVFEKAGKVNPKLQEAEVSTMVGTIIFLSSVELIKNKCPDASEETVRYFSYIGHQSGTGALKYVLGQSCSTEDSPTHVEQYYINHKSNRSALEIANESDTGAKRLQRFMTDLEIPAQSGKVVVAEDCPLSNPSLRNL